MEQIQKMEPGKYYVLESSASANSVYFETDALARLFFRYCNYYLKNCLYIREYALNQDGWVMLVKIKSAKTIRKYFGTIHSKRKIKSTVLESADSKPIWRILSERIRLFISTYVRMSNKVLGREGSLVRRTYTRYQFDSLNQAQAYISTIRENKHQLQQSKKKYCGLTEHFRMSGTVLTNPLRSSLWIEKCSYTAQIRVELEKIFGEECKVLKGLGRLVALNFSLAKKSTHHKP